MLLGFADANCKRVLLDIRHARYDPSALFLPNRFLELWVFQNFTIAEAASQHGLNFYLLGATEEVNRQCEEKLRITYPRLNVVGRRNGYFNKDEEEGICAAINEAQADIVWVGLGKPKEQLFCVKNRNRLKVAWLVTCGGCYNFITGHYSRAPRWMQNIHLEWLHRMLTNPRELFWRYLTTNPHALYLIATRTNDTSTSPTREAPN